MIVILLLGTIANALQIKTNQDGVNFDILDGDTSLVEIIKTGYKIDSSPFFSTTNNLIQYGITTRYSFEEINNNPDFIKVITEISSTKEYQNIQFGFIWDAKIAGNKKFDVKMINYGMTLSKDDTYYSLLFEDFEDVTNKAGLSYNSNRNSAAARIFTNRQGGYPDAKEQEQMNIFWKINLTKSKPTKVIYYLYKGNYQAPKFSVDSTKSVESKYNYDHHISIDATIEYSNAATISACYDFINENGQVVLTKDELPIAATFTYDISLPSVAGRYVLKLYAKNGVYNSTSVKYNVEVEHSNANVKPSLEFIGDTPSELEINITYIFRVNITDPDDNTLNVSKKIDGKIYSSEIINKEAESTTYDIKITPKENFLGKEFTISLAVRDSSEEVSISHKFTVVKQKPKFELIDSINDTIEINHADHIAVHGRISLSLSNKTVSAIYEMYNISNNLVNSGTLATLETTNDLLSKEFNANIELPEYDDAYYTVKIFAKYDDVVSSFNKTIIVQVHNTKVKLEFITEVPEQFEVNREYSIRVKITDEDDDAIMVGTGIDDAAPVYTSVNLENHQLEKDFTFKLSDDNINKDVKISIYAKDSSDQVQTITKQVKCVNAFSAIPTFELIENITEEVYSHDKEINVHARYGIDLIGKLVTAKYEIRNNETDELVNSGDMDSFTTTETAKTKEFNFNVPIPEDNIVYKLILKSVSDGKTSKLISKEFLSVNEKIKLEFIGDTPSELEINITYIFRVNITDPDDNTLNVSKKIDGKIYSSEIINKEAESTTYDIKITPKENFLGKEFTISLAVRDSSEEVSISHKFTVVKQKPKFELIDSINDTIEINHADHIAVHGRISLSLSNKTVSAIYEMYNISNNLVNSGTLATLETTNDLLSKEFNANIELPEYDDAYYTVKIFAKYDDVVSSFNKTIIVQVHNTKVKLEFITEVPEQFEVNREYSIRVKITDEDDGYVMVAMGLNHLITKFKQVNLDDHVIEKYFNFTLNETYLNQNVTIYIYAEDSSKQRINISKEVTVIPVQPNEPKTDPEEPKTDPEEPTTDPEEPKTNPEEPTTDPEEPKTNPEEPKTDPEEPKTNPEEPKTGPEEPKTNPEEPKTNPEEPKTGPEEPKTGPEVSKSSPEVSKPNSGLNSKNREKMRKSIGIGVSCALLVIISIIVVIIVIKKKNVDKANQENEDKSLDMVGDETGNFSTFEEHSTRDNPLFSTAEAELNDEFAPDDEVQDSL